MVQVTVSYAKFLLKLTSKSLQITLILLLLALDFHCYITCLLHSGCAQDPLTVWRSGITA